MARFAAALCAVLLTGLLLSGCSGSSESTTQPTGTTGTTSTGPSTSHGTTSSTGTTAPPGGGGTGSNHAPTGSISASVQQGPAPIEVKFDLTGTDADGDALHWNLDVDGDGKTDRSDTKLPTAITTNYTQAGTYNVSFTISDGTDSVTYPTSIQVTGAAGGTLQTITGSWPLGNPPICSGGLEPNPYHPANQGQNNYTMMSRAVDPSTIGHTFEAVFGPAGTGEMSQYVYFSNPDTISLGTFTSDTGTVSDVVPDDSEMVTFLICGPAGNSVTYTVTA